MFTQSNTNSCTNTYLLPKTMLVKMMTNKQFLFGLQSEEKVSVDIASVVDAVSFQDYLDVLQGVAVREDGGCQFLEALE